ncbi:MAG: F0F1 ATP synthase subunit B [bacterium]|nr:F0F1 ATP synthase subunit B [bacterium]
MEGHGGVISISWQILLVELVSFLILLFVLGKFLFKPITKLLENRTNQIKNTFETIETEKQDIEKIKQDYQNQLNELNKKAGEIIQEATKEGDIQRQKIIDQSQKEANKLVERATAVIEKEKEKAILELKNQTADLSILAASKILGSSIDESMAYQLVDEFIEGMDKETLH